LKVKRVALRYTVVCEIAVSIEESNAAPLYVFGGHDEALASTIQFHRAALCPWSNQLSEPHAQHGELTPKQGTA
jgi:hypothetical protein